MIGHLAKTVMRGLDPRIHLLEKNGLPGQVAKDALRAFARQRRIIIH
jgi:hypothetical protein